MTASPAPPPPPTTTADAPDFDAVFGRGPDGAPAWLRPAAFEGEGFDPAAYIVEAKKLV